MSSFIKNRNIQKRKSGIPILDKFINSLDNGILILIKEDEYSYIHNYLLNIYMSEGWHSKEQELLTFYKDGCPEIYDKINNENCTEKLSKMVIAWRYKDLKRNIEECEYSLTNQIDLNYECLLKQKVDLNSILDKLENYKSYRIGIHSLFSPSFEKTNIEVWLYKIKKAVRKNNHICMISIPTFFYEDIIFNQFFDIVLSLDSNIFTGYLPNYKALLHFEKISLPSKIRENDTDTFKFGIKFSKNKLVIEKIDIPPEDLENNQSCITF